MELTLPQTQPPRTPEIPSPVPCSWWTSKVEALVTEPAQRNDNINRAISLRDSTEKASHLSCQESRLEVSHIRSTRVSARNLEVSQIGQRPQLPHLRGECTYAASSFKEKAQVFHRQFFPPLSGMNLLHIPSTNGDYPAECENPHNYN